MPDEPKPEGVPAGPEKPAEGEKPPAAPPDAPPAAKPAAPAAAKPAAPAAHAPPNLRRRWRPRPGKAISRVSSRNSSAIRSPNSPPTSDRIFWSLSRRRHRPILEFLKLEADFDYLVDLTAVDYPKRAERFDLVYILYSFARNERIRVKTMIADGAKPATAITVH